MIKTLGTSFAGASTAGTLENGPLFFAPFKVGEDIPVDTDSGIGRVWGVRPHRLGKGIVRVISRGQTIHGNHFINVQRYKYLQEKNSEVPVLYLESTMPVYPDINRKAYDECDAFLKKPAV